MAQISRTRTLSEVDPEIAQAIGHEVERQAGTLELIASKLVGGWFIVSQEHSFGGLKLRTCDDFLLAGCWLS